jgi:GT2 family glycosyltransferase
MRLWVCIPVFNRLGLTSRCIESLERQDYADYCLVVCDDGSTDGTADYLRERHPDVILLEGDGELWWTGATNRCIEYVLDNCDPADAVITLNNDLEVGPDYLSELAKVAQRYPASLVGSASYDIATGNLVDSGFRHSWISGSARRLDPKADSMPADPDVAEVTHLPGRGTLVPVRTLREIGLFDFGHLPHYGADYDLSFRAARHGYRVLIAYQARVMSHVEETGLTQIRKRFSPSAFWHYLTSRRSPGNLAVRFWLAVNNCPRWLLPWYFLVDFGRVMGGYFKHHLWGRP